MKMFLSLAAATVLIAAGIFFWLNPGALSGLFGSAAPAQPVATTTPEVVVRSTYASTTLGLTVRYPREFRLDDQYDYPFSATKTIPDMVRFLVPEAMATGTNLSAESYVSVEQLPRATACTGDIFIVDNVRASTMTDGSVTYSLATTSGAAAGSRYEEMVYALPQSKPCTAVRYRIHTTEISNYPEGSVRLFDRAALLAEFDEIRRSLTLTPAAQ
jgi:hypothetical protein